MSPQYPIFICPNCRAGADLEADVDELAEEWQQMKKEEEAEAEAESGNEALARVETKAVPGAPNLAQEALTPERATPDEVEVDPMDVTVNITPESPQRGILPLH